MIVDGKPMCVIKRTNFVLRGEMQAGEDPRSAVLFVVLCRSRLALEVNAMCARGSPFSRFTPSPLSSRKH